MQQDPTGGRPMTSNRGAGFTSAPNRKFDPLSRSGGGALGANGGMLAKKADATAEEQAKDMERKVHALLEESAALAVKGDAANGGCAGQGCVCGGGGSTSMRGERGWRLGVWR